MATKAIGTAESLKPLADAKIGYAFSVQNGVLKNELLEAAFGADHVLGALANMSGELLPSGEVLFTRNVSCRSELCAEAFRMPCARSPTPSTPPVCAPQPCPI